MSVDASNKDVSFAAGIAAVGVELLIHPLDTLITRIQSPAYTSAYQRVNGSVKPALYRGLYQGFGPTIITSIPASVAFFTIYETMKSTLQPNEGIQPSKTRELATYALSSAVADLVACAITNPAEVLKQNAQVVHAQSEHSRSPLLSTVRRFSRHPTKLWTGYTMLAASHLPGTSLTFLLYEYLKTSCGALASAVVSMLFVPVDVVKTRMRLAAGTPTYARLPLKADIRPIPPSVKAERVSSANAVAVAKGILVKDGIRGLFRGGALTCLAAGLGGGLFLGSYDGLKVYFGGQV
ncbi:putative mitochondrial carrier protein (Pet8) [Aspergillus novofumigatus IBT 16806]|uniref:Putative mitochondrial carrier protein n=1 Tax=Aspergillus novofumigatus (strain IBT 16806) TaxID=1392255 RepID=A0A2I1BXM4_ASPN1|nr:putative mitochondrial carrier protein [Aspergillus novofumigatus IBT 16806]PKX90081.1 putative mitochondrial carrier protein [Aspergillus novofumigatus IBT 16806]